MNYQAIIFDLDGTISDTEIIWEHATKKIIENYGITITKEQEKQLTKELHGSSLYAATKFLKLFFNIEKSVEELMQQKANIAHTLFEKHLQFIDGFLEFHEKVTNSGYKTAIATNATTQSLEITNRTLGLNRFFGKHMYCMGHVNNMNKPNPAVYLYAADQLGVLPQHCLAIEDSPHGITAAKEAGMKCIAIDTSKRKNQLVHADIIVDHYSEISL